MGSLTKDVLDMTGMPHTETPTIALPHRETKACHIRLGKACQAMLRTIEVHQIA